ncbi:MAG: hypothetical protein AAF958_05690 [Planctomycetota bacterium]
MNPSNTPRSALALTLPRFRMLGCVGALLVCFASSAAAQRVQSGMELTDLFEREDRLAELLGDDAFAPEPDAPALRELIEIPDPNKQRIDGFARQLLSVAGQNDVRRAEVIDSLYRIDRHEFADAQLRQIDLSKSPEQLAAVAAAINPASRVGLATSPRVGAQAKQVLAKLAEAIKTTRTQPAKINRWIDQLEQPGGLNNAIVIGNLIQAGTAGSVAIVNRFFQPQSALPPGALAIAARIEPSTPTALRSAIAYGDAAMVARAAQGLRVLDADASVVERAAARSILGNLNTPSSDLVAALQLRWQNAHDNLATIDNGGTSQRVWYLDDQSVFKTARVGPVLAGYRDAVDVAALWFRVANGEASQLAWAVSDAGYRVVSDLDWGSGESADEAVQRWLRAHPRNADLEFWSACVQLALDVDDPAALLGLTHVGAMLIQGTEPISVPPAFLSTMTQLTQHPEVWIRYEAAAAIDEHWAGVPFKNRSFVKRTWAEMMRLDELPTVIVVETRPEILRYIETTLEPLGYRIESVSSVAQLRRQLVRGGDLRMIVSKRQLADRPPVELVDEVRRTSITSRVPIVFFDEPAIGDTLDLYADRSREPMAPIVDKRNEWIIRRIPFPKTPSAWQPILDDVNRQRHLPPLSPVDRGDFERRVSGPRVLGSPVAGS